MLSRTQDGKQPWSSYVLLNISPNQRIEDIQLFIHRALQEYSEAGSRILAQNFHQTPLILASDLNNIFADKKSKPLITFVLDKLNLFAIHVIKRSLFIREFELVFSKHSSVCNCIYNSYTNINFWLSC